MARHEVVARAASGAAIVLLGCSLASAQDGGGQVADRPRAVSGLFGPHDPDLNANSALDFAGSLLGGYDTYRVPGIADAGLGPGRDVYNAQGALAYQLTRDHASFVASGSGGYAYWPHSVVSSARYMNAMVGGTVDLNTRFSISTAGHVQYAPDYFVGDFGQGLGLDLFQLNGSSQASSAGVPLGLRGILRTTISSDAAVNASIRVTDRSTLTLTYGVRDVTQPDAIGGLRTQRAGARYAKRLTEHASLVLGYLGGRGFYKDVPGSTIQSHDVEAGVEYGRPLTLSRKTTFSFRTGSTIVSRDGSLDGASGNRGYGVYASGFATLNQEIAGTWSAHVAYRRGLQLIEGLSTPFFSDMVASSIDGYAGQRLFLTAGVGYSSGSSASAGASGRLNSGYAAAHARYAVAQYVALLASYAFRRYDLGTGLSLTTGLATELEQSGARVGITVWLPLWR